MPSSFHAAPDLAAVDKNWFKEHEGERLRAELTEWLRKNKIVSIMLDTDEHSVRIDIAKLPPRTKSVLSMWGSIRVIDDQE